MVRLSLLVFAVVFFGLTWFRVAMVMDKAPRANVIALSGDVEQPTLVDGDTLLNVRSDPPALRRVYLASRQVRMIDLPADTSPELIAAARRGEDLALVTGRSSYGPKQVFVLRGDRLETRGKIDSGEVLGLAWAGDHLEVVGRADERLVIHSFPGTPRALSFDGDPETVEFVAPGPEGWMPHAHAKPSNEDDEDEEEEVLCDSSVANLVRRSSVDGVMVQDGGTLRQLRGPDGEVMDYVRSDFIVSDGKLTPIWRDGEDSYLEGRWLIVDSRLANVRVRPAGTEGGPSIGRLPWFSTVGLYPSSNGGVWGFTERGHVFRLGQSLERLDGQRVSDRVAAASPVRRGALLACQWLLLPLLSIAFVMGLVRGRRMTHHLAWGAAAYLVVFAAAAPIAWILTIP
jgi:hypothetical protein